MSHPRAAKHVHACAHESHLDKDAYSSAQSIHRPADPDTSITVYSNAALDLALHTINIRAMSQALLELMQDGLRDVQHHFLAPAAVSIYDKPLQAALVSAQGRPGHDMRDHAALKDACCFLKAAAVACEALRKDALRLLFNEVSNIIRFCAHEHSLRCFASSSLKAAPTAWVMARLKHTKNNRIQFSVVLPAPSY